MPTIVDRNIAWNRKFVFIPYTAHSLATTGTSGSQNVYSKDSGAAGADVLSEVGTTDLWALLSSASGALDTGSSFITPPLLMPYDLDYAKNIGVGVVWAHDTTGAGLTSITWTVTYSAAIFGANIYNSAGGATTGNNGGMLTEPTTALDTTIAAQTTGTFAVANVGEVCVSPRGIINANKFVNTNGIWAFRTRESARVGGTTNVYFLGLLFDYAVHKTRGATAATLDRGPLQNYLDQSFNPATTVP